MDEPRGKILRDYRVPEEELKPFNLPRQPGTDDRYAPTQRHPGVGQVRGTTNSMGPKSVASGAAAAAGAFFTMRTVASGGADNGDIYLQGGNVSGGTGNEAVAEFLLFDASGPTWAGTAGQFLELAITGSGQETSGILDPIYNVTSVATPAAVGSLGANTLPSSGDVASKVCRVSLGTFITDGFQPAAIGDINIGLCWGGYTINRIA